LALTNRRASQADPTAPKADARLRVQALRLVRLDTGENMVRLVAKAVASREHVRRRWANCL
jgi:hypothetical protein